MQNIYTYIFGKHCRHWDEKQKVQTLRVQRNTQPTIQALTM